MHNPTALNRQGSDVGTQYRSVIFYHDEEQRKLAETYKNKLDQSHVFEAPIVTEISPFTTYFNAEEEHKDYYLRNPDQGYCRVVIKPKLERFKEAFADTLK